MPPQAPRISIPTLLFFRSIVRIYFWRHFRSVLIQNAQTLQQQTGPLILYGNHASWWDPMVSVLLAHKLLPGRKHYAPIDAVPLLRYPILRRIGVFPVELGTPRGAAQFLRTSEAVLKAGGVLWITPQGRFADVREHPLAFKSGLAVLAQRVPNATILPLAVEYAFWNERLPETLIRIGHPVTIDANSSTTQVTQQLESTLEALMEDLRASSIARDPLAFNVLVEGGRGTGGFYALGRRIRAFFSGKGFHEDRSARDARAEAGKR